MQARLPTRLWLRACGLATLSGVLYFLGWVGFGMAPLSWVALVPLWAALEVVRHRGWKAGCLIGWLAGTVAVAGGYHWMFELCQRFAGFGTPVNVVIFAGFSAYLGFQYAVQATLYVLLRNRGAGVPSSAIPPLLVAEWLFPTWFPTYLGNALAPYSPLLQMADLGGPLLLSGFLAVVNVAAFEAIRWLRGKRPVPKGIVGAVVLFAVTALSYGYLRASEIDARVREAPSIEVGIAQVNMGVFDKQEQMLEAHRRYLAQSRELERDGELDLLIWPETAYLYPRIQRSFPARATEIRGGLRSPLLFGALSTTMVTGYPQLFNSTYLVGRDAILGPGYDKNQLTVFGEYLPLGRRFPRLYLYFRGGGRFTPGSHLQPHLLGGWRISTPICYEAILPRLVRRMVREANPHLLVNVTNDAWFGETQEPYIHLELARLRAIEHRRFLIRSTNSGVSAIIGPTGRIQGGTELGTRANLRGTVSLLEGATPYTRVGDWVGWAALLWLVLGLAWKRTPAARASPTSAGSTSPSRS